MCRQKLYYSSDSKYRQILDGPPDLSLHMALESGVQCFHIVCLFGSEFVCNEYNYQINIIIISGFN